MHLILASSFAPKKPQPREKRRQTVIASTMAIENNPKPTLPSVDAKKPASVDTLADEVIQGLKAAGACIIKNLYSQETVDKFEQEVKPYLSEAGNLTCKAVTIPLEHVVTSNRVLWERHRFSEECGDRHRASGQVGDVCSRGHWEPNVDQSARLFSHLLKRNILGMDVRGPCPSHPALGITQIKLTNF
jgi:Protein of unknown function (DUF1479)